MPTLSLFLLGQPHVEIDEMPVSLDTRKAVALIAYLALTRKQQGRDRLATLLWPDTDQSHARAALRRAIFDLNKSRVSDWLIIERDTVGLDFRSDLRVDVLDFQSCLAECTTHGHAASEVCSACMKPLSRAVSLYQDNFMTSFSLRDSDNFDDRQFSQADTLQHDYAGEIERLVYCYSASRDFGTAITYARRWLALGRLHEPAHRQLMLLYAWAGGRAAVLHQYGACVQVLEQELGVAPLEATTQLYRLIKANQTPSPPPPLQAPALMAEPQRTHATGSPRSAASSSPVTPASAVFPLVGRADEARAV